MLKRVFITGANSGVGYELAKQYILRGDDVALFDLHFSEQTKQRLTKLADFCQYVEFFAIRICDIETLQIQVNNAIAAIGKPELAIECSSFCIEYSEQLTQKHSLVSHHFATVITPYLEMNSHLALTTPITEPTKLSLNPALLLLSKKLRLKLKPSNIKVSLVCTNKAHSTDVNSAKIAKHMLHSLDKQKLMVILGLQSKLTYIMSRYLPNWIMGSIMDRLLKQQLIRTTR